MHAQQDYKGNCIYIKAVNQFAIKY